MLAQESRGSETQEHSTGQVLVQLKSWQKLGKEAALSRGEEHVGSLTLQKKKTCSTKISPLHLEKHWSFLNNVIIFLSQHLLAMSPWLSYFSLGFTESKVCLNKSCNQANCMASVREIRISRIKTEITSVY